MQPQPSPTSSTPPAAKRPRRASSNRVAARRTARGDAPEVASAPAPKKVRKPRVAKKTVAKPSGKLGINEIVSATVGLKENEATVLLNIVQSLEHLKKSAKPKVLAALGKLFG
jgi:hypothetical protein